MIPSQGSLGETLREVEPTFFFGVPRYPLLFVLHVRARRGLSNQFGQSICLSAVCLSVSFTVSPVKINPLNSNDNYSCLGHMLSAGTIHFEDRFCASGSLIPRLLLLGGVITPPRGPRQALLSLGAGDFPFRVGCWPVCAGLLSDDDRL